MDLSETSIVNATLWLLAFFSLLTWSIILLKIGEWALSSFRNRIFKNQIGKSNGDILKFTATASSSSQLARIVQSGLQMLNQMPEQPGLPPQQYTAWHELITRAMQQQLQKEKANMESGLGWLASFGSTSPFVGLFGTVWGIMHALQDISTKGSASLEVVAGPIGEALIATAIGIAVAIPAVLGYNFFIRLNRSNLAKLSHYAEDYQQAVIKHHLQQQTGIAHVLPTTK